MVATQEVTISEDQQGVLPVPADKPAKPLTIAEFTDNYGPGHSGLLYAVHFLEKQVLDAGHRLLVVAPVAET